MDPAARIPRVAPVGAFTLSTAHVTRPRVGESENGDAVILRCAGDLTLFGIVDGVGHGSEAAAAARAARERLERVSLTSGIRSVMESLHHVLAPTRGAAVTLCIFDGRRLEGAGVGNVILRALGPSIPALLSPGILGHRLARLRTFDAELTPGDRIAIFSDGVSRHVDLGRVRSMRPAAACEAIFRAGSHPHDDASILIADVLGA